MLLVDRAVEPNGEVEQRRPLPQRLVQRPPVERDEAPEMADHTNETGEYLGQDAMYGLHYIDTPQPDGWRGHGRELGMWTTLTPWTL